MLHQTTRTPYPSVIQGIYLKGRIRQRQGDIEPFMGLIRSGEVLHVGKGTGFGLGRYKIRI
ncbi:MAG TPA: CRISPR system precrRNA processing endoribonuclease RAMP protein Cas6 [Nitrospirae bacterium]|nr:CRISPR system precrRNA processing endoribonuclease RAMP protein Cas6 [Nitrospirota bacterium]